MIEEKKIEGEIEITLEDKVVKKICQKIIESLDKPEIALAERYIFMLDTFCKPELEHSEVKYRVMIETLRLLNK